MPASSTTIKDLEQKLERTEEALRDSESRYQHLVARTHGLICTHDLDGVLLSVNPAATEILGYEAAEMVGHDLREFLPAPAREKFGDFLEAIRVNDADKGTLVITAKDGRLKIFQYHNVKMQGPTGDYVLGYAYDVTELKELQEKLEELTVTDDLTGLYNRRGFMSRSEDRMRMARRVGEGLFLIFADVDGLKKINDAFGHACGSQVINETAEILRDSCRQTDVISRWGGDEFLILLGRVTAGGPEVVTQRFETKIAEFNKRSGRPYKLSLSLGVVPVDTSSDDSLESIIAQADERMYAKKRNRLS
ncbi:MAG TPA: sensor domain-containing diguanylate cyclase [Pyrinomonadaceae bacterium]|nr:sensor domain-containing diguanylate cyclase [Pyrinomonadaceae bacterium]